MIYDIYHNHCYSFSFSESLLLSLHAQHCSTPQRFQWLLRTCGISKTRFFGFWFNLVYGCRYSLFFYRLGSPANNNVLLNRLFGQSQLTNEFELILRPNDLLRPRTKNQKKVTSPYSKHETRISLFLFQLVFPVNLTFLLTLSVLCQALTELACSLRSSEYYLENI